MTLKDYYATLTKMIEEDPSILDCDVIYCTDEEGNSYNPSYYTPTVCYTNDVKYDMEVIGQEGVVNEDEEYYNIKVICIN